MHYAYVHCRPNGEVFYVGKGTLARAKRMSRANRHHRNIVTKHGRDNILVGTLPCSSESVAFDLERGLIRCFTRMGVRLANRTNGGEGRSGTHPGVLSESHRARISAAHKGVPLSEEHRKRISEVQFGRKQSEATKARRSAALKGRPRPLEVIAKIKATKQQQRARMAQNGN